MTRILSIETAVRGCSVAVHADGHLLAATQLQNDKVASSLLTSLIQTVVDYAGIGFADLNAIAISEGPGSYTGLRIGTSTAKGLCFGLDIPLLALNTLQIMRAAVQFPLRENDYLLPLIDARRMEVYCQLYRGDSVEPLDDVRAEVVDDETFLPYLAEHKVYFFGDGAAKLKPLYTPYPQAVFLPDAAWLSAAAMGELAFDAFRKKNFADLADFEPNYLKPYFATTPKNQLSP